MSAIPIGGTVVVRNPHASNDFIMIYRRTATAVSAHDALCTHMGCTLPAGRTNVVMCGCHGSRFRASDGGVINGPNDTDPGSISPLPAVPVTVVNGVVYLA